MSHFMETNPNKNTNENTTMKTNIVTNIVKKPKTYNDLLIEMKAKAKSLGYEIKINEEQSYIEFKKDGILYDRIKIFSSNAFAISYIDYD